MEKVCPMLELRLDCLSLSRRIEHRPQECKPLESMTLPPLPFRSRSNRGGNRRAGHVSGNAYRRHLLRIGRVSVLDSKEVNAFTSADSNHEGVGACPVQFDDSYTKIGKEG